MSKLKELCTNRNLVVDLLNCTRFERREALFLADSVGFKWTSGRKMLEQRITVGVVIDHGRCICLSNMAVSHAPKEFYEGHQDYCDNIVTLDHFKFLVEDHLYEQA